MSRQVDDRPDVRPLARMTVTGPRSARALLAGLCVLFVAWILVIPPFGGTDEYDHAYRAAAAARGEWTIDPVAATRGTGAFLHVPNDIVKAAQPRCQQLTYTQDVDCVGKPAGEGERIVASGAGRYHPLFYAVIGTPALPFEGATALYVMRLVTALLAAAFVWVAVRAASTWSRSRWPFAGIAVAGTPVALYSASIAAPNGVEMMSALALWMALMGLLLAPPQHTVRLAVYAGVSGAVLATLRPLGPLWCLLVFAAVLIAVRPVTGRIHTLLRTPMVLAGAGLVFVSALQGTVWTLTSGALELGHEQTEPSSLGHRISAAATQLPAWILQPIAAFPMRNQATHAAVYACFLLLFGVVVVLGLRCGVARVRVAICLVAATVIAFPYVSTVLSWDKYQAAWQGRYGLPLAMGLVLLACYALDRAGHQLRGPVRLTLGLLYVVAQTVAVGYTLHVTTGESKAIDVSAWLQPSMPLAVALAAVGSTLLWWGAFGDDLSRREPTNAPA